jgi:hypothetical protein
VLELVRKRIGYTVLPSALLPDETVKAAWLRCAGHFGGDAREAYSTRHSNPLMQRNPKHLTCILPFGNIAEWR